MTPVEGGAPQGLLERERELQTIADAVHAGASSRGGMVVVEAAAGIGKTSLLAEARRLGEAAGFRVVSARGAELEQGFPYGVVRQFFESFLFTVEPAGRERWMRETSAMAARMFGAPAAGPAGPAEEFALLHSLYWLCVRIADERPLLMVLDDAQWADAPSLKYVEFSSRRLEQLPFVFVVATRPPDRDAPAPLVALLGDPSVQVVRPGPLSADGVGQLVRDRVDSVADAEFALACHEVTRGNPFLLGELVHEIREEGLRATSAAAGRVRAIGPRGVSRVVLLRLRRLPDSARRLATALSVAGDGAALAEVGQLAELSEQEVAEAAAGLERAELVDLREGARFTHPVIRAAVHDDLSQHERSELHRRAAALLVARGHPDAEVAAHLLHTEPGSEAWVVAALWAAAAQAEAAGAVATAAALLERARRERVPEAQDAELLAALGRCEARAGKAVGAEHLRAALARAVEPGRVAETAIELGNVLKLSGRADEAAVVLTETLGRLDDPPEPLLRRVHAELLGTRFISAAAAARVREAIGGAPLPLGAPSDLLDAFLLAQDAFDAVAGLRPAAEVVRLGRPVLEDRGTVADPVLGGQVLIVASVALIWAEDFEFVARRLSAALVEARRSGAVLALGNHSTMRAMCAYRAGRLLEAESDAATVLELGFEVEGLRTLLPPAVAYAVLSGIERGTALDRLVAQAFDARLDAARELLPFTQLLWARGELLLAAGDPEGALAHFRACDQEDPGFGGGNPTMVPWREGAALALTRLGDFDTARALTRDAVSRARAFGAPRALGVALRADALAGPTEARVAALREAVDVLSGADATLELVRTRCDLGAALRASRQRVEAQRELEVAHAAAVQIGAQRLAARAAEELEAAGVRPRREPARGLAALTPSERRVAQMAAEGLTNREIAQQLFVTEKTVETHLGHVYDKLDVRSRRKLPDALGVDRAA